LKLDWLLLFLKYYLKLMEGKHENKEEKRRYK